MDALSYLESRCSLRRNVLTGEISYAPHRSNDYKPLSKRVSIPSFLKQDATV